MAATPLRTLAVANYRSLRELVLPLGNLNVVTGANGSGKSNLYRGLRLLSETAFGTAVESLAAEGGLQSVLWAGPETIASSVRRGEHPVQGVARRKPVNLRLGFAADDYGYAIDFGMPTPVPRTLFGKDPQIKREAIWQGDRWHDRRALVDRRGSVLRRRDEAGRWQVVDQHLPGFDSMLSRLADPRHAPEALLLRERIRSWRFYDHFRTDAGSPVRWPQVGTRTPALANDGRDLAAAWRTIEEIGDGDALHEALTDAFPGATVRVREDGGRFGLEFHQHGLLRPLSQAELSDGTLRYLLWIAALLTPRPPSLMVLNEPETSLHPDLLPALGRLMRKYAEGQQIWITTHAESLLQPLLTAEDCNHLQLDKEFGATFAQGLAPLDRPAWRWPPR